MRINLVVNVHRADAVDAARKTAKWLASRGSEVGVEAESAAAVGLGAVEPEHIAESGLVVAFGGDGTLIRAAHLCSEVGTPILGVYYGRFGFVTQCLGSDVRECIAAFLDQKIGIESRMMVEAVLCRNGQPLVNIHALNEVILQRDVTSRMMTFSVEVDGRLLTSYPADGVLVSTPTGSTAYNLSAGGPILAPNVSALLLTALAPHTLTARSLVLAPDSEIRLAVQSVGDAVLSADGQARLHLLAGDEVRVRKSARLTNLVSVEQEDFLQKLAYRLQWSQGIMGDARE